LVIDVNRYAATTALAFPATPRGRHPARTAAHAPTNTPRWMTR
jgi:hypothetical protein